MTPTNKSFFFFLDFYSYQVRKIDFIKNLIRIRSQMMLYLTNEINRFVCDSLCMRFEPPTLLIYLFQFWWWPANSHQPRVTATCLVANLFLAALKKDWQLLGLSAQLTRSNPHRLLDGTGNYLTSNLLLTI